MEPSLSLTISHYFNMKHIEVETKYNAEGIERADFDKLCRSFNPKKELLLSSDGDGKPSIDHYFTKGEKFMRFRYGSGKWELTSKVKTTEGNNKVRVEVNINLGSGMSFEKAEAFSAIFGLEHDFSIIKDVQVFWFDKIVLSHYTCYDKEMKKLNTFLEIEADEAYKWDTQEQALAEVVEWEKKLSPLGITPQKRVKRSLFEFYTTKGEK
jgi:adenylate cyclase class IV